MDPVAIVTKRSRQDIETLAADVRSVLKVLPSDIMSLPHVIEIALPQIFDEFFLRIVPDGEMRGVEASVAVTRPEMIMSETTYKALCKGEPRARFTAAHELGHLFMHSGEHVHYARRGELADAVNPEWQANAFAAAFLMPESEFRKCLTVEDAKARFGVGYRSAQLRAQTLKHKWKGTKKTGSRLQPAPRSKKS